MSTLTIEVCEIHSLYYISKLQNIIVGKQSARCNTIQLTTVMVPRAPDGLYKRTSILSVASVTNELGPIAYVTSYPKVAHLLSTH